MAMTPIDRKVELLRKGKSMSDIARALEVTPGHVSQVVAGERRSPRVEAAVAAAIGRPVQAVFPAGKRDAVPA